MVIVRLFVLVSDGVELSATRTVKEKDPAALGVPVIAPDELSVSPVGSGPEPVLSDQVYGATPPDALRFAE
jgi:hypothetical protein